MTIFQKMLIIPALSLLLYTSFILYSYSKHHQSNLKIESVRDSYLPLLTIADKNISNFKEITVIFKDSVIAHESSWIKNSKAIKNAIEANLNSLQNSQDLINNKDINKARKVFQDYFNSAQLLALALIEGEESLSEHEDIVTNIEKFHGQTEELFSKMRENINLSFIRTIDEANQMMENLLWLGIVISIFLLLLFVTVTLYLSLSTRKYLLEVGTRMKDLALGGTDFSKRINSSRNDEIGTLIKWFNKLSLKLEQDFKKLEIISNTDKLTQINNRTHLDHILNEVMNEFESNKKVSLAIVDIDYFKKVNDEYGHLVGDQVLIEFAKLLLKSLKSTHYVGRWGGEEFLIIMNNENLESAIQLANDLRLNIYQNDFPEGLKITASFGVTQIHIGDNIEDIIKRADDNLYKAKQKGRNRVIAKN